MELLDKYLNAVRPLLPKEDRQDILAELSEEIRSQIEDREATLGRPLTENEQEEILQRYGHPVLVGGRYRTGEGRLAFGKELIGPELFPVYLRTLKITLGIASVIAAAIMATVSIWEPIGFGDVLASFALQIGIQFVVLTAIFTVAQKHFAENPGHWDRRQPLPTCEGKNRKPGERFEALVQLAVTGVILSWVVGMLRSPQSVATNGVELTPIWRAAAWPVIVSMVITMVHAAATLIRPSFARLTVPIRILATFIWLGALLFLLQAGHWVVLNNPTGNVDARRHEIVFLNDVFIRYGLISTAIGTAIVLGWDVVSFLKSRRI